MRDATTLFCQMHFLPLNEFASQLFYTTKQEQTTYCVLTTWSDSEKIFLWMLCYFLFLSAADEYVCRR